MYKTVHGVLQKVSFDRLARW